MTFDEKHMAISGVYKYLKRKGFNFKNKTERNAFIEEFLKAHNLPINTKHSPTYSIFKKNALEVQKDFGAFVRWCSKKKKEMQLEEMVKEFM